MKKNYVPQPRSRFFKIQCECGNVQEIFSHATTSVNCRVCGKILTRPRSGKVEIFAEIIEVFE